MSDELKQTVSEPSKKSEEIQETTLQAQQVTAEQDKKEEKPVDDRNFIEKEMESYRGYLNRSWESAYKRFGLYLFHSLTAEERVKYMETLGFEPIDARDYYNKAVLCIQSNDYTKAEELLKKALELEPEHSESLYNMAVLLEKTNRKIEALNYWEQYLGIIDNEEEIKAIAEHLEEEV